MKVPRTELDDRLDRFRARMDRTQPGWKMAAITGKIPLYYFTGTMPDGLLLVPQDGDAVFWVRQSYERAVDESFFPDLRKMRSFRDVAAGMGTIPREMFLETDLVPIAQLQRMQKHLPFTTVKSVDAEVSAIRAKKSPYELALM
jgi:Xaa-Pro aminopeptidase